MKIEYPDVPKQANAIQNKENIESIPQMSQCPKPTR